MVLLLACGGSYIPTKASEIPAPFTKLLKNGKIQQIVALGNIDKEYLKSICIDIKAVFGYDDNVNSPVQFLNFSLNQPTSIGVMNGYQLFDEEMAYFASLHLNCDILITQGTRLKCIEHKDKMIIYTGSLTGAFQDTKITEDKEWRLRDGQPSFVLLDINQHVTIYTYQLGEKLKDGKWIEDVKVERLDYKKEK
eukprot:NODE_22_length_42145_cov_1.310612.p26 type:complete len:194 gc:universal NODE_22_length_42145_cov_1.310612:16074-15493(-)